MIQPTASPATSAGLARSRRSSDLATPVIPDQLRTDLLLGHRLADAAAAISLAFHRGTFECWAKSDGSLATEADLAVEDALRRMLAAERPGDAVLGEERGETGSSQRRWIIDAIDGTVEFADGSSEWGTLIALEVDGCVTVAVCDQPANARRYWAVRGHGAYRSPAPAGNGHRLRVSDARDVRSARSYVPPEGWWPTARAAAIASDLAGITTPRPHSDHPALQVATGGYEFGVFFLAGPWDIAAPSLIVEEAGGRFTDLEGRPDVHTGTALFSNGVMHDEVLGLIQRTSLGDFTV